MNNILYFIEKHKYGIVVALILHLGVFLYLQMKTYEERVPFEAWSFQGKNIEAPDDIEITPDQIESFEEAQLDPEFFREITSHVTNMNDEREKSTSKNEYYSSYKGNAEENIRDFEKSVIASLQGQRVSEEETSTSDIESQDGNEKHETTSTSNKTGSDKAYAGETMVSYDLKNRYPLNNNDWHIRNPGYTCGYNSMGTVQIRIKVNKNGNVIDAQIESASPSGISSCMKSKALEYARKSRFNYKASANSVQTGYISYKFISQ